MSEPLHMSSFVTGLLRQHVTQPMTTEQVQAWKLRMVTAYWELSGLPAFQAVLEDWTLGVLLAPCETAQDEGRRRFVLSIMEKVREAVDWKTGRSLRVEVQR